ncbi:VPS35 endosomal protein-sorting factor-like isoform X2 [Gigantopelta aegis]|uniref:VPS35 endosomal protein-sorting factor-like isoform X2 n=1 Tax=Gigantopelta aegis TaxID=1735272 RepID=UPI001B888BA2|nr:VPS35 endosomal protein-sorting factor-like isoform X2 [Gigantopelta aegis]
MATIEWYPRQRNYDSERNFEACIPQPASSHPLKPVTVTEMKRAEKRGGSNTPQKSSTTTKTEFVDPLSLSDPLFQALDGSDPLSQLAAEKTSKSSGRSASFEGKGDKKSSNELDETFEPWSLKKAGILARFTTSEKLSITTSFLSSADKERVVMKTQTTTVSDKVKNRLEQLDDFEEGSVQEMLNLSQQDYVKRIDDLNLALINSWDQDQRVKALKIAIQCSKLLADVSVIPFYPSKFVLITDILDTFGKLVYNRLKEKAQYYPPGSGVPVKLPDNFTPSQVPESAKETCRNWFFKIASIRELVPRFFVECAILKCYSFLNPGEYAEALNRLTLMTRGIGNPLVSIHAKCYLSRVGILVAPSIRNHLMPCFNDFLMAFSQLHSDSVQNTLAVQKLEMSKYLTLYSPALDWILQCIANKSSEKTLSEILEKCQQECNSALLVNSIMAAFQPEFIANRAIMFTEMIKDCEDTGFPKHLLYRTLGICVVMADPPEDQRLAVLNEVWKAVVKLKNPMDYIGCAEIWIEYVVKHFGKREVTTILSDIIKHMIPDRAFEDFYPQLQSVVSKILSYQHDFSLLFALDKFMPFIDLFQREAVKVEVCKNIAEAFSKHQVEVTNDPIVINAMMFICKTMHDAVNALTLDDEKRVIGNLICSFVRQISFGRDFEQQLSFFVEARASFSNLDAVLVQLIQSVNNLSIGTRKVVNGNHSRKTGAFVRACAAYCFITIPSLSSVFSQLQLYLLSGQVALLNQCFSQADAFFKAAISLIPDLPRTMEYDMKKSSESFLLEYLHHFVSTLLAVPDNPESGVLYLLRGLLNVLQDYTWDINGDAKVIFYTRVIAMMSASCQEFYLYHVDKVDSNDMMYASDPKYVNEVKTMANTLVNEILSHLKTLASPETARRQSYLSLELVQTIIAHGDVSEASLQTLVTNLWNLAQKNKQGDSKQMVTV